MLRKVLILAGLALTCAAPVAAQSNQGPPANPIFSLTGQPITTVYTEYSFTFTAAEALTNLTFAMRDDPAFIYLDDISMALAGTANNLLVNGGFEDGPIGSSAPTGWSYLNQYGAAAGGTVQNFEGVAHTGSNAYYDGAVQAYDAITQEVATTVGAAYTVSFWVRETGSSGLYQPLSTNGNTGAGGNGIDLFVYAQAGAPAADVPEPATWAMMVGGFGAVGGAMRRRRSAKTVIA